MNKHYNYLDIDIDKKVYKRIRATQYDTKSRYILVSLISNSVAYDLTDTVVRIYGIKQDKKIFFNNAVIKNTKNGQFEIELTNQALAVVGELKIQILVMGANGEKLTSSAFFIDIEESIVDENAIESTNEFNALTEGLKNLAEYDVYRQNVNNNKKNIEEHSKKLDEHSSQIKDIEYKNFETSKLKTLTEKRGLKENSYKLGIKNNDNEYNIIQKTDKGYVMHTLKSGEGDTGTASIGTNYDLLRLRASEQISEAILWKEPVPATGTLTTSIEASTFNSIERQLSEIEVSKSKSNKVGLKLYDLAANQEVTFKFTTNSKSKANILYLSNTNRSESVDICINDIIVKNINSNKGFGGYYTIDEFDVPSNSYTSTEYTVKIKNNSSNKFSFVCFNYSTLDKYDGKQIDSYKVYQLDRFFINAVGASDYAIRDNDLGKWCGSYHGGEVSEYAKMTWNNTGKYGYDSYENEFNLSDITSEFTVLKNLNITQKTNINNKAKMLSIFDFNTDGTVHMQYSLADNTINATDIYTALTCTHTNFTYLAYPTLEQINLNGDTTIFDNTGYIEQYSSDSRMKLAIRYNLFDSKYNTLGSYITHNANYAKFYHGIVTNYSEGITIPNLTFSKCLDFYNLKLT